MPTLAMPPLTPDAARLGAQLLSLGRVALGVIAFSAPTVPGRTWIGEEARNPGAKTFARSLGGRDLAIGLGGLLALRHGGPTRGWMEAGALVDASDVAGTLIGWRSLPRSGRWFTLVVAGSSLVVSRALAARVDAD